MVWKFFGFRVGIELPTRSARTEPASPAPDGPGSLRVVLRLAKTSSGNPVLLVRIGYKLHPRVKAFGPLLHHWSNGRSQPPEKTNTLRTSVSPEARN